MTPNTMMRFLLFLVMLAGQGAALAQVEGRHFTRLKNQPSPPSGQIEVIEFFAYSCPHCYRLDPVLDTWRKSNAGRIRFRRVHVETRGFELHQRLFFALQARRLEEAHHQKIFQAFHEEGNLLRSERGIGAFMKKAGMEANELDALFKSPEAEKEMAAARQLQERLGISKWPAIVVGGLFVTDPERAAADVPEVDEARAIELTMLTLTKMLRLAEHANRSPRAGAQNE
jgi:thiol:disulfide interchange protein DsbA